MILIYILGFAALILLTIAFKLEERHAIIKFFALMFAIFCLLMLGNLALKTTTVCSTEIYNTTVVNNITTYTYARQCFTDTTNENTTKIFYNVTLWFFRLTILYMLGFVIYLVMDYLNRVNNMRRP